MSAGSGGNVRFDDMIATLTTWPAEGPASSRRVWLQLVDMLAAGRAPTEEAAALFRRLAASVPAEDRRAAARRAARLRPSPALIALFAEDADVARPLLAEARLSAEQWDKVLPVMPEAARAILTARHDLPAPIAARLSGRDAEPVAPPAPSPEPDPIRDLLARIEAFHAVPRDEQVETFAFTIDGAGRIALEDGRVLGARLGDMPVGVDGHALGAWRAGERFADARLTIADGPEAGEWRISAAPAMDAAGYRGQARRPRADETAAPLTPPLPEAAVGGGLARAIEAIRVPLAGLTGGSGDDLGEAGGDVIARGLDLAEAIEQFDLARLALATDEDEVDLATVIARLDAALAPLAAARGVTLSFRVARGLPVVDADALAVERMVSRLIGASLALARPRERLVARVGLDRERGGMIALSLTRPGRLVGRSAQALRSLHDGEAGGDAPLLAFGFALRLVERLAAEVGGDLIIHDDRLRLTLPGRRGASERRQG